MILTGRNEPGNSTSQGQLIEVHYLPTTTRILYPLHHAHREHPRRLQILMSGTLKQLPHPLHLIGRRNLPLLGPHHEPRRTTRGHPRILVLSVSELPVRHRATTSQSEQHKRHHQQADPAASPPQHIGARLSPGVVVCHPNVLSRHQQQRGWKITTSAGPHFLDVAAKELQADGYRLAGVAEHGVPLIGWLTGGVGNADDHTALGHVRDSESLEVLLMVRTAHTPMDRRWWTPVPTGSVPTIECREIDAELHRRDQVVIAYCHWLPALGGLGQWKLPTQADLQDQVGKCSVRVNIARTTEHPVPPNHQD
ncbi:hypothetical protein ACIG87_27435 [Micromonospora sp. NPDC051925]|uniref:hypothetical protein n=1 Tax=Micromonospora sp. NPDC051925 TaxID=3364288 RepID=UPI0037C867EE